MWIFFFFLLSHFHETISTGKLEIQHYIASLTRVVLHGLAASVLCVHSRTRGALTTEQETPRRTQAVQTRRAVLGPF